MFGVIVVPPASIGHMPDLSNTTETLVAAIVLSVVFFVSGILAHLLARKSKTGLELSAWWGARSSLTMTDSKVFAYANRKVWKYNYVIAMIFYTVAILLLLMFFMLIFVGVTIIDIVFYVMVISILSSCMATVGIGIYSSIIANKAAKEYLDGRRESDFTDKIKRKKEEGGEDS